MSGEQLDIDAILRELDAAGGKAKSIFLHILCQALQCRGVFILNNTYEDPVTGKTHLVYRHPHSNRPYDCEKPELNEEQRQHVEAEVEAILKGNV